ncbi:MAG: glycosyltransferase family 39 protein [Anaerolineae bacterium]|nr:glycosyltransferase family 39 protein [Anaerolineae bacterium]MDW8100336.1 glycosyltransferase family 39 protein [Anaerolineae bacterium]
MNRLHLIGLLLLALIANAILGLPLPLPWQALASLSLTVFIPGAFLTSLLRSDSSGGRDHFPIGILEFLACSIAAGFAIAIASLLILAYLPGPLDRAMTWIAFNALCAVLAALHLRSPRLRSPIDQMSELPSWRSVQPGWWLAALMLFILAAWLRLAHLGYSEFNGDEARATLRAVAVIQGYDDTLFLHRKAPAEILLPTAILALTGHLSEATARLPFALANLAGLVALLCLGWRLFGPFAGLTAAALLALDGYFIAFARFTQYQSLVFLSTVTTLLLLARGADQPELAVRRLTLAALIFGAGLLAHYEAILAIIPASLLLLRIRSLRPIHQYMIPFTTAVLLFALFYIPFALHPNFQATLTYITADRIGSGFLYNNVADFFHRTSLYSSMYAPILMGVLMLLALLLLYYRCLSRPWRWFLASAALATIALTAWDSHFLRMAKMDLLVLPWGAVLITTCLLPRLSIPLRAVLLWWAFPLILAFFFVKEPRTHVYVFFPPYALLAGWAVQEVRREIESFFRFWWVQIAGLAVAVVLIVMLSFHAYLAFVRPLPEFLPSYEQNLPAVYPRADFASLTEGLFSFPLNNGWKVVGMLYERGIIAGDYDTNKERSWLSAWYTRGQPRCRRTAQWYFEMQMSNLPTREEQRLREAYLQRGFQLWGIVEVNGIPKLRIYHPVSDPSAPRVFQLEEWEPSFNRLAPTEVPLEYPVVIPKISHRLHVNLDNRLWLEGYDLEYRSPLRPGDTFLLRLYWRVERSLSQSYTVFNQVRAEDGRIVAQLDGTPVCDLYPTHKWDPGELIVDSYRIEIKPDTTPGIYTLYSGMYLFETGERLPVLDVAGNPVGNEIRLGEIQIEGR